MIEVDGTVTDATTGQGIPGATVAVNGKPVTIADGNGRFAAQVDTYGDQLTASAVGYKDVTLEADYVAQSGLLELPLDPTTLATAVVTATHKTNYWPWLILGGVLVLGSSRRTSRAVSGKGSDLIPIALVGAGAYLLLRPHTSTIPAGSTVTTPSGPITSPTSGNSSIFNPGNIANITSIFKGLFGGSSSPSTDPGVTDPTDTSYDPTTDPSSVDTGMAGIGATTTLNAGDIIGKTLVAAMDVPVYDVAQDGATPSGTIKKGNPIGIVYSYLNPDPTEGRAELWWMFEPLPGDTSTIGDNLGYYYTPHNPDYFDTQALLDAGVLTVAQATALKQDQGSTLDSYLKKYLPWVGGILIAGIAIKSVINKAI